MPTPPRRLLLVDDDVELLDLLCKLLTSEGFSVATCNTGEDGVRLALSGRFDCSILDIMLPGIDGLETLRRIRLQSRLPIIMLTARGEDVDRIIGLETGADDYLPKPFNPRELIARIRAILRRTEIQTRLPASGPITERLAVGDIVMDVGGRRITRSGAEVELTGVEFDLLAALLRAPGAVVERAALFRAVLDREPDPFDRSIDMHVSHLRKKLGPAADGAERIKSIRGVGYVYALATATTT